jgi:hypothetical protein
MLARGMARASVVELWSEPGAQFWDAGDFQVTQRVNFVIVEMCKVHREVAGRSVPTVYIMRPYRLAVKICSAQLSIVCKFAASCQVQKGHAT